jgi:hypothetical protein
MDWNSKIDCRVPWLISGWYGVYEVRNSPREMIAPIAEGTIYLSQCLILREGRWKVELSFVPRLNVGEEVV